MFRPRRYVLDTAFLPFFAYHPIWRNSCFLDKKMPRLYVLAKEAPQFSRASRPAAFGLLIDLFEGRTLRQ